MTKSKTLKLLTLVALTAFCGLLTVCKYPASQTVLPARDADLPEANLKDEPILPVPTEIKLDAKKVALGERLFNDKRLSHDDSISCASCHSLELGGTDQLARSVGIKGQKGAVNAPTVYNSGFNFKQFWDGRAESLEAQIDGPTHAPDEMGSTWEEIEQKLRQSPEDVSEFTAIYRDGIRTENIKDAIAAFERSLITPNSRFDKFLRGNEQALTKEELDGYRTFKTVGCISCHQGVNVGGNLFQEFGVMGDYFIDRGNITKADLGRFNVTQHESDKYVFKVPSLRNVSQTHPYFHDGSAQTLEDAVMVMSKYQLGRELSAEEIASIVRFLRTLDGEYKRYNP